MATAIEYGFIAAGVAVAVYAGASSLGVNPFTPESDHVTFQNNWKKACTEKAAEATTVFVKNSTGIDVQMGCNPYQNLPPRQIK